MSVKQFKNKLRYGSREELLNDIAENCEPQWLIDQNDDEWRESAKAFAKDEFKYHTTKDLYNVMIHYRKERGKL